MGKSKNPKITALAILLGICVLPECASCLQADLNIIVMDNWLARTSVEFSKAWGVGGDIKVNFEPDLVHLQRFTSGECQIVAWSTSPADLYAGGWIYGFKAEKLKDSAVVIGQSRLVAIVNKSNSASSLSIGKLQRVLSEGGKDATWATVGGSGGKVKCYAESMKSPSRLTAWRCCMQYAKKFGNLSEICHCPFRKDIEECENAEEVLKKVRADTNGIGFVQFMGKLPKDVKVLAISKDDGGLAVVPLETPVIQDNYPLSEKLVFYIHPTKPAAAMKFAQFAIGPEGSKIVEQHGLVTPHMQGQYESVLRLKDMKSGKGVKLTSAGVAGGSALAQLLAVDYVQAKAVVQMQYSTSDMDTPSIGMFVSGPAGGYEKVSPVRELLLLDDRPGDQAMKVHGEKWNALNPKEYMPAGRAVAIVVPAASKLQSLTLEQVKSIFSGQVKNWKLLGLESSRLGQDGKINCYGVQDVKGEPVSLTVAIAAAMPTTAPASPAANAAGPSASQAGSLFRKEVPGMAGVSIKKDAAEACSAVSTDPNGIAFVDLAAIPEKGQSIKIIAIGDPDKAVVPSPETIKNATYPLSQRLYLYVHPRASDTAKDFAKFVATCGQSEASPYTDTVKSVAETFRKNGLVPLAAPAAVQAGTLTGPAPLPATLPSATTRPAAALTPAPDKR